MTYKETINYLYTRTPMFQKVGQGAYKEGLENTYALDEHFGHPHTHYRTIHIAGTNGKGTCSHTLASVLQEAGYRVGLYTSPHLLDFRERIRVNGEMISEQRVIDFVEKEKDFFEPLYPSFFEVVTALAFKYFEEEKVDVAVIEVGLGGRLDCTNIIHPVLSLITNISFDHVALLGDTLEKIAGEKAGIIKKNVPVVIGENHPETRPVFEAKAKEVGAPIIFAEDASELLYHRSNRNGGINYGTKSFGKIKSVLGGFCQTKNTNTILHALNILKDQFNLSEKNIQDGFKNVITNTHLMGRWQKLHDAPTVVCDTGHNIGGFQYITKQLRAQRCKTLRVVLGMVNDKDINGVLSLLPKNAVYYFTQASVKRALPHEEIRTLAEKHQLKGNSYPSVKEAVEVALSDASSEDFIYVGGSTFIVADLLDSQIFPIFA